jgi:hypothetical protein
VQTSAIFGWYFGEQDHVAVRPPASARLSTRRAVVQGAFERDVPQDAVVIFHTHPLLCVMVPQELERACAGAAPRATRTAVTRARPSFGVIAMEFGSAP